MPQLDKPIGEESVLDALDGGTISEVAFAYFL